MYIENQIPSRQQDEKLILFLRRHWIILIGRWLIFFVLALIPPLFYFFLNMNYPWILTDRILYPALLLLTSSYCLFILLFLFNAFIDYFLDIWIVTNQRIININQRGLFNREISENDINRIQDVTGIQKGFFPTLFSYGDVHLQTAGEVQRFVFHQVYKPFDVVRVLNDLVEKHGQEFDNKVFQAIREEKKGPE